ncbi:glycosyltransferase [Priestia megaterium]
MSNDVYLTFNGEEIVETNKQLFTNVFNTFTIELWAKPNTAHTIDKQFKRGILPITDQRFAIAPVFGGKKDGDISRAGVGVSIGTNGISVYEHTTNHLVASLVYAGSLNGWNHVAVVYINKTPFLYLNGNLVRKGVPSQKKIVVPSGVFGGLNSSGFYIGSLKEIRIWSSARKKLELKQNMYGELKKSEQNLIGYWKLTEGIGNVAVDSSGNGNHGTIKEGNWNIIQGKKHTPENLSILFTFFIPSGGVETLNRQRFYALDKNGVKCDFLYTQAGTGLQNKINTSVFVTNKESEIKDILLKGNYDGIVVGSDLLLLQQIRKLGYKGPLIYEIQGLGFNKEYAEEFLKNHAHSIIQNYCDAILYPKTPHLMKAFEENFPFKKKFCFHNCFNIEEFKYQVHPQHEKPIIGWVGRLEENKNWRDFLSIGAALVQDNPSIQLWMFEDNTLSTPKERLAFEKKIKELELKNNLTIYANQPHSKMAEYFSIIGDSGGFLCSTSKVEGFGYAVLEAMVCKCPVLSSDSDGVRSFIKHNITGKYFSLENLNQAVNEGKELMLNTSLREKIREEALEHIELNFSPDQYAENFTNMIYKLENKNKMDQEID